jgi:hypothetical protein
LVDATLASPLTPPPAQLNSYELAGERNYPDQRPAVSSRN